MEGLLGKMRASVFARARQAEITLETDRDLVPDSEDLSADLKPYIGKPMKAFFDNVLTDKHRNAVAHFVTNDGALHVSSAGEFYEYAGLALITDLCARALIARHEELLAQLGS
jgi:hypothetical protein